MTNPNYRRPLSGGNPAGVNSSAESLGLSAIFTTMATQGGNVSFCCPGVADANTPPLHGAGIIEAKHSATMLILPKFLISSAQALFPWKQGDQQTRMSFEPFTRFPPDFWSYPC